MGHEKKWNDRQVKTVLGVKQILFISTTENKRRQCGEYASLY